MLVFFSLINKIIITTNFAIHFCSNKKLKLSITFFFFVGFYLKFFLNKFTIKHVSYNHQNLYYAFFKTRIYSLLKIHNIITITLQTKYIRYAINMKMLNKCKLKYTLTFKWNYYYLSFKNIQLAQIVINNMHFYL